MKAPLPGPEWSPRQIDNFLPSRLALDIVFQKVRLAEGASDAGARERTLASRTGNDSGMALQPLPILKTNAERASRRLTSFGKRIDHAIPVFPDPGAKRFGEDGA
ncbi:MAG: hypothetical protein WCF81_04685 [Roseiarcus sp.]